ncbi:heterokaryon incompatibility, partial [Cercophora newfieldiana]
YDALSYTWGDHVPSQFRAISCNGCTVSVTPSLFSALSRLRYPYQPRNLWVDAICINQQNDEEKAVQIQHMLTIYMKARTVVGWLGPESSQTKAAVYALRSHGAEGMEVSMSFLELSSEIYGGLVDLYSRPWFRRLWVQQEVFAARR